MRLWPYQMLDVLPRKQLLSQLRENTLLSIVIERDGKTNHILINKIMDYDLSEFKTYCEMVVGEMFSRGYKVAPKTLVKLGIDEEFSLEDYPRDSVIFEGWHNDRYLTQCLLNLQEKYDCGGLTVDEWGKLETKFEHLFFTC